MMRKGGEAPDRINASDRLAARQCSTRDCAERRIAMRAMDSATVFAQCSSRIRASSVEAAGGSSVSVLGNSRPGFPAPAENPTPKF